MIPKLAWRNLGRQPRRTLITALTVAFGLWLTATFTALNEHSYRATLETGAKMGLGHVAILPQGALKSPSNDKRFPGAAPLRERALALPHVTYASPRIAGQGILTAGSRSRGVHFIGVQPAWEDPAANPFLRALVEGAPFDRPDARGVILGRELAARLKLNLGSKVILTTTDREREMVGDALRVVALFDTGVPDLDANVALIPFQRAGSLLGYAPDEANQLVVLLDDFDAAEATRDALQPALPPQAEALAWQETLADLLSFMALDRASNQVFQGFIALLIAAGVLNTLLMSVLERTRELGILLALGLSPWRMAAMVLLESLYVGLLGIALGALLMVPWAWYLDVYGLDFSAFYGGEGTTMNGVLVDPVLRFRMPPGEAARLVVALLALAVGAGIYPAWRAGRITPMETLRII